MTEDTFLDATVKFFDDAKGFGFVSIPGGEDAFVGRSTLPGTGYRTLFPSEPVAVCVEQGNRGLRVTALHAPDERQAGHVIEFDFKRGHGLIRSDSGADIFAHYSNILTRSGKAELIVGEEVEFSARPRDRGQEAYLIKRLDARPPLDRYASITDEQWLSLAALAEREPWGFDDPDPDLGGTDVDEVRDAERATAQVPILVGYIRYTFARLVEEEKVVRAVREGHTFEAFNTGLVTPNQEEIYGLFEAQPERGDGHKCRFVGWTKASDNRISGLFTARPPLATYWSDPSQLFFQPDREIVLDYDHFVQDNLYRYPPMLAANPDLARMATVAAVDSARRRVARNYKTAVPQYYRGEIQLLLPLSLDGSGRAQLALVVRSVGSEYIGETVLTLHDALGNARLLAKPDRDWLNP